MNLPCVSRGSTRSEQDTDAGASELAVQPSSSTSWLCDQRPAALPPNLSAPPVFFVDKMDITIVHTLQVCYKTKAQSQLALGVTAVTVSLQEGVQG